MRLRDVSIETLVCEGGAATPAEAPAPARSAGRTEAAFRRLPTDRDEALEAIYGLEADRLFALALWITGSREDAADAVHDLFVKLAARPPRLTEIRRPRAYLLSMVRSIALDRVRRRRQVEAPEDCLLEAPASDPESSVEAGNVSRHLHRLPRSQREAVYLRFFAELSFADIGRVTGVSLFTAASRCRLGLAKLRHLMGVER